MSRAPRILEQVPGRALKSQSQWKAQITSTPLNIHTDYFDSGGDTARAYDNYVLGHNINMQLKTNADDAPVARERGSVYQGVTSTELDSVKRKFVARGPVTVAGEHMGGPGTYTPGVFTTKHKRRSHTTPTRDRCRQRRV